MLQDKEIKEENKAVEESEEIQTKDELKSEDENFDEMLEDSWMTIPEYDVGDKVTGKIIEITKSYIFISLPGKRDAYAEKSEYREKSGKLNYKEGDKLTGFIIKSDDNEIVIAKSITSANKAILRSAYEEKIPVSGKVVASIKGGFKINIANLKAFCPISQIDLKVVTEPYDYVGKTYDFEITELSKNARNIVVSRKVILEREKNKKKKETLEKMEVGDVVEGKVTRLTNFGAFIQLGGVEGLIHISEMAWERVDSPSDIVSIGDTIKAKIIKIKGEKISLSLKELQPDPYEDVFNDINVGDVIKCKVLRNLHFGSFVEIKPGVEGLIPISEMSRTRHIKHPSNILKTGDTVEVQIIRINQSKKKITLSLKALQPDPWDNIHDKLTPGDVIEGEVENVKKFGTFVKIADGIVGLLPRSKMKLSAIDLDKDNIGETVKLRVAKVDGIRKRISLEPTDIPEEKKPEEKWKKNKKSKKEMMLEDNPFTDL